LLIYCISATTSLEHFNIFHFRPVPSSAPHHLPSPVVSADDLHKFNFSSAHRHLPTPVVTSDGRKKRSPSIISLSPVSVRREKELSRSRSKSLKSRAKRSDSAEIRKRHIKSSRHRDRSSSRGRKSYSRSSSRSSSRSRSYSRDRRSRSYSRERSRDRKTKNKKSRDKRSRSYSRDKHSHSKKRSRSRSHSRDKYSHSKRRSRSYDKPLKSSYDDLKRSTPPNKLRYEDQDVQMPAKPFEGHKKSRSPPPRYNDEDHRILEFVAAEQALIERLDKDKTRYMADSQLHPDYNKEWENFYQSKCRERGTANVDVDAINPEWVDVWKDYFYKNYERCAREERNRLMNKHKILRRTLEEFSKRHGDDPKEHWLKQKRLRRLRSRAKGR
jgi:hypothetical protein